MKQHDHRGLGGRSALERLGNELSARDSERETRERLKIARVDARRDRSDEAIVGLRSIMAQLWDRIDELAPMTMTFSANQLELEQAQLEWDIEHAFVHEHAFERSGWDVYAGAWIRLHQRDSVFDYPGCSSSIWYAKLPDSPQAAWYEVAYNATEGNAPAEEPFALKDLIKADLVASSEPSNLVHALQPSCMEGEGNEAFLDRWMGLLAASAIGDLERPSTNASYGIDAHEPEDQDSASTSDAPTNTIYRRLRRLAE